MHIVFYLAIIITDLIRSCIPDTYYRAAAICDICRIAVYSVCSVIFGVIVNLLATKILAITALSKHTQL